MAANEKAQRRFRIAVLIGLSNIERMVQMIHAAQIVEAHGWKPCSEGNVRDHAKNAEEFISKHSKELVLEMVKYVNDAEVHHSDGSVPPSPQVHP